MHDMSLFYQDMEIVHGDLNDVVRGMPAGSFRTSKDDASTIDPVKNNFQEPSAKNSSLSPNQVEPITSAHCAVSGPRPHNVKRRKGQAKKVICIPAPTRADQESNKSSSSCVVVPSDLWAWRKYGQKPIKGSPYPRGYYRCSSSKGCLARKQVERSRSDPNMLVITYTSEHNHPWPTHRNSLAGSTRSSSIRTSNVNNINPTSNNSSTILDESYSMPIEAIKEETDIDFDRVFKQDYEPMMTLESSDLDVFGNLGGLDPNPMSFFMSSRDIIGNNIVEDQEVENKSLDPLSFFDNWDEN